MVRAIRFILGCFYFFCGLSCVFIAVFAYANVYFAIGLGAVGIFSLFNGARICSA